MKLTILSLKHYSYVLLCLIAIFVSLYHPTLTNDYMHGDDYFDFLPREDNGRGGTWVFDKRLLEGRPIYAAIFYLNAWFVESLSDVKWIRLFGILGISLASWCVFYELVRQKFDRIPSFFVAVIVGMCVPFQLAASWATISIFPYAFAISYAAFLIAEHSLKQRTAIKYVLIAASTVCLLMVLYIYQPIALAFWAFFAIGTLRKQNITGNDIRRILIYLCITAAAICLSYLTYKITHSLFTYDYPGRGKFISIFDIPESILQLIKRMATAVIFPITPNEYSWDVSYLARVPAFLPLVVVLLGLVLYFREKPSFMKRCVIACALPALCHGIMLITDSTDPQRTRMALSFLVILYVFLAVHGYAKHIRRYVNRTMSPSTFVNCVMGVVAFYGVALSYWHHERQFVKANVREIEFIRSELQYHDLRCYNAIHVVRPKCGTSTSFVPRGYFSPSSCFPWAVNSMVKFLLIDLHADTLLLRLSNSEYGDNDKPVPRTNTLVIDMERGVRAYRTGGTGAQ